MPTPHTTLLPIAVPAPPYSRLPPSRALEGSVAALYVHVPFCSVKCHYCDFYSLAGHLQQAPEFLQALRTQASLEVAHLGRPAPETIFIGGGTPTLLAPGDLTKLLAILHERADLAGLREFTVEANPNTFDDARAQVLAAAGVNRISFGAQSFQGAELLTLQRDHDPAHVPAAMETARRAGIHNINLDLIFGIPGQTMATLADNLHQALQCQPDHISCYNLMYEPNTPLTARLKRGEFSPCDESVELDMFQRIRDTLGAAGLEQYEISNFARPGKTCRHNLHYWSGGNALAWGPSAAAHHSGYRWAGVRNLTHYLQALRREVLPVVEMEHLSGPRRWGELAMLMLRTTAGIDRAAFADRTGLDAGEILQPLTARYGAIELLNITPTHVRLTQHAWPLSDTVFADVLEMFAKV